MRTSTIRATALLAIAALSACSGSGTPLSPVARAPIATSSAPANTSSKTRATFVVHWPSIAQAAAARKRRQTLSPSTQSISVAVNGSLATIVNKPTLSGSPSTTSVSIPAPAGNDSFTFTAWDQVDGAGSILDQSSATQDIIADANNTVSVALDGVCAALVPTLSGTPTFISYQNGSIPLASGSRTVLESARLIGPSGKIFVFTRVDADGNTILTSAGNAPIAVKESGTTPHFTVAPYGTSGTTFTLTPTLAEPDGFSTTVTATSPDCGTGTPTFPNSFQLSTSAEVVVADQNSGILAYDQDGTLIATLLAGSGYRGVAYNSKSTYLVAILPNVNEPGQIEFLTLSPTGALMGNGSFAPHTTSGDPYVSDETPGNIAYDLANGEYYFVLGDYLYDSATGPSIAPGAIEEYSISGSTATYVNATSAPYNPTTLSALPSGNVVVNDLDVSTTYIFSDTLSAVASAAVSTASLAFDSTRGNIINTGSNGNQGANIGTVLNQSLSAVTNFTYPTSNIVSASAYNPGTDEMYFFGESTFFIAGLAGVTVYEGGSATSNLASGAFSGLSAPIQAVVLP